MTYTDVCDKPMQWVAWLLATSSGVELMRLNDVFTSLFATADWHSTANSAIGVVNTALFTLGSTLIILYHRKRNVDRDMEEQAAREASSAEAISRLSERVDRLSLMYDRLVHRVLEPQDDAAPRKECDGENETHDRESD